MLNYKFVKRIFDFTASVFILTVLSPIILLITFLLIISNKGNPFFFQKRPGRNENLFTMIKFKTMNDATDAEGNLLPDSERLTILGKFIRKTSLDEILQLMNVLKGEMSLIGPRPLLIEYLPYYSERERLRHSVRPGITGLAQISGRNMLPWDQRLEKDVEYVENLTLGMDLSIILKTVEKVISGKDIVLAPQTTMPRLDELRSEQDVISAIKV